MARINDSAAREMHRSGALDPEIAIAFGVSRSAVERWRARNGIPSNRVKKYLTESEKTEAVRLHESGASDAEIARRIGALTATVCRWRKRVGLPAIVKFRTGLKAQVLALLEQGLTPQQIADQIQCATSYVRATRARQKNPDQSRAYSRKAYAAHAQLIGRASK